MLNLGNTNYTMKPFCGNGCNNPAPHSYFDKTQSVSFCGVTEELSNKFAKTQKEIIDEFVKDPASNWVAGNLPKGWLEKISYLPKEKQKDAQQKVFMLFRAAIKHLKPYCATKGSPEFNQHKVELENKRIKEASLFLTKGLRKFGILPETNSVNFKRLKVSGSYTQRGYLLREKGKNPTLDKLFIKKFNNKHKLNGLDADYNGPFSEIAHGLFLNKKIKSRFMCDFYWGDMKAGYLAAEYQTLPKKTSPIINFKNTYKSVKEFLNELYDTTNIKSNELLRYGIKAGKMTEAGFKPDTKGNIIIGFLQAILAKHGLYHNDLHNLNAIIGSNKNHKPLVKLVDIGGLCQSSK